MITASFSETEQSIVELIARWDGRTEEYVKSQLVRHEDTWTYQNPEVAAWAKRHSGGSSSDNLFWILERSDLLKSLQVRVGFDSHGVVLRFPSNPPSQNGN